MDMQNKECDIKECGCKCGCHKFKGIFIILLGLTFLLGNLGILSSHAVSVIWPLLIVFLGLSFAFRKNICKCCNK